MINGKAICPVCGKEHPDTIKTSTESLNISGHRVVYEDSYYKCPVSGFEYQSAEQVEAGLAQVRKKLVETTVGDIDEINSVYTAINLSSRERRQHIVDAFKEGAETDVSDVHRYAAKNPENINCRELLPHWFLSYSSPLLFIVDNFACLRENKEYFEDRACKEDLVIDKCCCVKYFYEVCGAEPESYLDAALKAAKAFNKELGSETFDK